MNESCPYPFMTEDGAYFKAVFFAAPILRTDEEWERLLGVEHG